MVEASWESLGEEASWKAGETWERRERLGWERIERRETWEASGLGVA
jgi:hypothetical protein